MSNSAVGQVYQRIIQEVIQTSQVDFEEAGVDGSTLEELKQVWQRKLSSLNVAQFPWDPPALQQTSISNPAPIPSNAPRHASGATSQPPPQASAPAPMQNGGTKIKTEPGYEPDHLSSLQTAQNSQSSGNPTNVAAMRAAGLISQKFPGQATNQVNALHGKTTPGLMLPGQRPVMQYPGQGQSQQAQQQQGQQQQQQQQRNALTGAQSDGTSDAKEQWTAVMMRRNALGQNEEVATIEIDNLIRRGVEKMGISMEGGGLMLPLSELHPRKEAKKRRRATAKPSTARETPTVHAPLPSTSIASPASRPKIPHFDGTGDDSDEETKMKPEAFDEDAINSDLDDPDEDLDEEDGEEDSMSQIMLCTYDKVQRVKNKWKCVLKDGVLTINGKEYVFHKATGDYEWY